MDSKRRRVNRNGNYIYEDWEEQFIIDHWFKMDDEDIGKKIGRTKASVKARRHKLGLSRLVPKSQGVNRNKRSWNEYNIDRKVSKMRRLIAEYETAYMIRRQAIKEELRTLSGL